MKKRFFSIILACLISILAVVTMTACEGKKELCLHEYAENKCVKCGASLPSEGLAYKLSTDKSYYLVKSIGECDDENIVIPAVYNELPVKAIESDAFRNNTRILSVEIHEGITNINPYAFMGCKNLNSVKLPSTLEVIDWCSFRECTSLTEIDIPDNVYHIEYGAFKDCKNLRSVNFGKKLKTIGSESFSHCMNLTSITLPSSVKNFGDKIFFNCSKLVEVCNLTKFDIQAGSEAYGYIAYYAKSVIKKAQNTKIVVDAQGFIFYNGDKALLLGNQGDMTGISLPQDFNGKSYEVYDYAFQNRSDLSNVVLSDSVTKIGKCAFSGCPNLLSVEIGDNVTEVGDSAFFMSSNLKEVSLGAKVNVIGSNAMRSCSALSTLRYNGTASNWSKISKGEAWNLLTSAKFVNCTDVDVAI